VTKVDVWGWESPSPNELVQKLRAVPHRVPPRGCGRTKDHVEAWTICHLLATLSRTACLHFPLRLQKGERPDFDIESHSGAIGVEITEAIPEDYAQAVAIENTKYPERKAQVDEALFAWGSPKKSPQDIHRLLEKSGDRFTGPGWVGDSVEREWATAVLETIRSKTAKLNEASFRRQPENWLAIFDNIPGAALDIDKAVQFLLPGLAAEPSRTAVFAKVFVLHSRELVVIDPNRWQRLPLVALDESAS
jgi:hypothetical protein